MSTNIGYWEKILKNPSPAYRELFVSQKEYIVNNITSADIVLDIGCGDGKNIVTILQATNHVFGVDNDLIAIKDAKERLKKYPEIDLLFADALSLPFKNETFDVVTFFEIIGNMGNSKISALKEVHRVLKKDGFIILSTYSENAFDERMKMYEQIQVPIEKIEGTKVYFDKSVGAYESEQSSIDDLIKMGEDSGFKMIDHVKVGTISYICKFIKA